MSSSGILALRRSNTKSIILTLLFMSLVLGKRSWVRSKILVGFCSLLTVLLSLGAAFGLMGYFRILYTPISIAVVFVLVGVGVDDMVELKTLYLLTLFFSRSSLLTPLKEKQTIKMQ